MLGYHEILSLLLVSLCIASVTAQTTKTGCEANNIEMTCSSGTFLLIEDMLFGRTDPTACKPVQVSNCKSLRWALPKLQQYCDGRSDCKMMVLTKQWGDPCPGVSKHGSVTYRCVDCTNTETDANCTQWASEGKCASEYKDMMTKCYKTCSQCDKKNCGNKHAQCDEWAMRGECKINPTWMNAHCQESCLNCVRLNPVYREFCEDDRVPFTCPEGHFLNILDVFWGRKDSTTCPGGTMTSTNCPTPTGTLTEARARFNGRPGAWFIAFKETWPVSSDAGCSTTHMAGHLLYDCRVCSNSLTDYTCHQLQQHRGCDSHYMMNKCYKTCSGCQYKQCGNKYTSSNDCAFKKSKNECVANTWTRNNCKETCGLCPQSDPECGDNYSVFSECDYWAGKGDCTKYKAWHTNNCPESCHYCPKQITTPTAPTPVSLSFCENDRKELVCPSGQGIFILSIFWGRKDNTTCAHGNIGTTNCPTPAAALDKARSLYNGRNRAWINAYNENWGNQCPNTFKAGSIDFVCRDCVDILSLATCHQHKQNGDCKTDSTMKDLCYKTCFECDKRQCGNTYTTDDDCANKAKRGLCTTNQFTKDNCKKSCNTCAANQACIDNFNPDSQCDYWAAKGECSATAEHMVKGCKESCNYCDISSSLVLDQITGGSSGGQITKNGCEGDHLLLECSNPNEYIQIVDMFYGRKDTTTCPHFQIHTTDCPTLPWALEKLQTFCDARERCYFNAWNGLWGDPCPGTAKVASVTYKCIACNNTETDIKCEQWRSEGKCKDVMTKCYKTCSQCGKRDCGNKYNGSPASNCDEWAMRIKGECKINPGFMSTNCTESCLLCTNPNPVSETFCEGKNVKLTCPAGQYISIDQMSWGRTDTTTCPHESIKTTNCPTQEGVLQKARDLYNGRQIGWVIGQSSVWGDPCPGTYKAGSVMYSCKACVDEGSNCAQFKAAGNCSTNYGEAMSQCFKTCTGCNTRACGNKYSTPASDCDFWAGQGDCHQQPFTDFHYTQCKESCNFCNKDRKDLVTPAISGSVITGKLQATTHTLCEGSEIKLTCPAGSYIRIKHMFYGRLDKYTCPHVSIYRTNCHSDSSNINELELFANGRSSFWFPAVSAAWGDSCVGTYKVAQVTYECDACTNSYSDSYCNQVLADGHCAYQMDRCFKTCSQCGQKDCGNSYTPPFDCKTAVTQNECNNDPIWMKEHCPKSCGMCNGNPFCMDINVAESLCDRWALSGKCGGEHSNLMSAQCKQSCLRCVEPVTQSVHMCEGLMKELRCPSGYYIHIEDVFWGRDSKSVCNSNVDVTNCTTKSGVFDKVAALLNGRNSGWFYASSGIWGDPCAKVTKEARVKYTCRACSNSVLDETCDTLTANGNCTSNYGYMGTNCFKSCSKCDKRKCGNTYTSTSNCWTWAANGECDKNKVWMSVNCREACNKCPVSQHFCGNNYSPDVYCDYHAGLGECTSSPEKMDKCKESCNKCPSGNGSQGIVTDE